MKKLINKLNFAIIGIMISLPALAADTATSQASTLNVNRAICDLATQFKPVISAFRTLAFIGAGITIAIWAWGWISEGKFDHKEVGKKGFGMLVGFIVLFALGGILTAFMSMTGVGGSLECVGTMFQ